MGNMERAPLGSWDFYMSRCFDLAQRAKGHTAPNPMVGAILVNGDRIIGEGWHHYYGADHAEVNCLKNVAEGDKQLVSESTMYVNLEPCAHHGITPPCADRLVREKVKEVVIANADPFEKVNGKGIDTLREAGIDVRTGVLEREGLWVNRRFFCFHNRKRPYIILKWAQSKDGFIAPDDRSRMQITCPDSKKLLHKWRTEEAAIMVGTTTALNDNPELTARLYEGKQPLRIILDKDLRVPHTHHVYDNKAATWIINEKKEILLGNVHSVPIPFDDNLFPALMRRLYDAKILSVIVEGGGSLLNSLINSDLWDEARIFTGAMSMRQGILAPVLTNETHAFTTEVGVDQLRVYLNNTSGFTHTDGLPL